MKIFPSLPLLLLFPLAACTSMSGLGGSSHLSCPMPDGSTCKSMSEVYRESFRKPKLAPVPTTSDAAQPVKATASRPVEPELSAEVGTPLLTGPRVMRIYIAPWTDADDNLMEGRRIYVKVEESRWRLDHVKAELSRSYGPVSAPAPQTPDAPDTDTGKPEPEPMTPQSPEP